MNSRIYEEMNDPDKWRPRMGEPLNAFEMARFQMGLNQIFGLAPDNSPNVRIVWGQNYEATKCFNRYSGEWYPRYLSFVQESSELNKDGLPVVKAEYVAAPRYVIEGRVSLAENASALAESGVETLAMLDEDGKQQVIAQDTFRPAVGEQWEELLRILDHDHIDPKQSACCQWNAAREFECWGYFRLPDAGDLKYLQAKWNQMRHIFETAPGEVRTAKEKQYLFNSRMAAFTEEKRRQKDEVKKALAEFWKSKFAQLDQSVTEQAHGPYHFLSGHNSAGRPAVDKG